MRIMRLKTLSALIGASLFAAPSLFAQIIGTGSLQITAPNYPPDQAGPYLVTVTPSTEVGVKPDANTFQTFCIGSQVDYYPGSPYSYQISSAVQPAGTVGGPGYVTWGTAWLYNQFLNGAWSLGGNSTTVQAATAESDALQVAIWTLQGQSLSGITFMGNSSSYNTSDVSTLLADAATAAALAGIGSDSNNANGAFGVYALNMYSGSPTTSTSVSYAQPELVRVPIPEPGTVFAGALMLLPFGLSVLRLMRNRMMCPAHAMATAEKRSFKSEIDISRLP